MSMSVAYLRSLPYCECEKNCGFKGSYDECVRHEKTCKGKVMHTKFECEKNCGFKGSYDQCVLHEMTCKGKLLYTNFQCKKKCGFRGTYDQCVRHEKMCKGNVAAKKIKKRRDESDKESEVRRREEKARTSGTSLVVVVVPPPLQLALNPQERVVDWAKLFNEFGTPSDASFLSQGQSSVQSQGMLVLVVRNPCTTFGATVYREMQGNVLWQKQLIEKAFGVMQMDLALWALRTYSMLPDLSYNCAITYMFQKKWTY